MTWEVIRQYLLQRTGILFPVRRVGRALSFWGMEYCEGRNGEGGEAGGRVAVGVEVRKRYKKDLL